MNRKSYGSSRSPRSEMEIQMETHKFWTLQCMTQAVRERVLKLAFPDRNPLVVGSGADLFVVYRPDPDTYTRRHLGTLGEEYAQLPVPPWVGIQGDDPWAEAVGQLMLAHEAEEAKRRFLEVLRERLEGPETPVS